METTLLALKGFAWTMGNWLFIGLGMITDKQVAVWFGCASAALQFGYTLYKWFKDVRADLKAGKKKLPFRVRKR